MGYQLKEALKLIILLGMVIGITGVTLFIVAFNHSLVQSVFN